MRRNVTAAEIALRDAVARRRNQYLREKAWGRFLFLTQSGEIVIGQAPNGPALISTILSIAAFGARFFSPAIPFTLGILASISWSYWAALELFAGVNRFRRLLGLCVLVPILVGLVVLILRWLDYSAR